MAADLHDHKLTIMFTPHWARYVTVPMCAPPDDGDADDHYEYRGVEYDDCLALVRAIEGHGHEIALHHHPFSYERSNWGHNCPLVLPCRMKPQRSRDGQEVR